MAAIVEVSEKLSLQPNVWKRAVRLPDFVLSANVLKFLRENRHKVNQNFVTLR